MRLCVSRLVILCLCLFDVASTSIIKFNGDPTTIQPALTQNMTLTCTLEDTPSSSGSLIGRDVDSTTENLASVTSLVIMRGDNNVVATITPGHPATALLDLGNVKVNGHMSGQVGERGKIQLTWAYPTMNQAGPYRCEVNGINSLGHNVVFSSEVQVEATTPTITDLVSYIHALQVKDQTVGEHLHNLTSENQLLGSKVGNLENENKILGNTVNDMNSTLSHLEHTETGTLDCGDSRTAWTGNSTGFYSFSRIPHTFSAPFSKAPKMQWGVTKLYYHDTRDDQPYVIYYIDILNVTSTGFLLQCSMEAFDHYYIHSLGVNWAALPNVL